MPHPTPHPGHSRLHVFVAAALFSTGGAAIKATALGGWAVASLRSWIAALTVLALLPEARRGWTRRTVLVGIGYATTLTLFVQANKLTTAANTIFLQATAPIYLMLLGPWLLQEPVRRRDYGFMAALAVGMALFFVGTEPTRATAPDPTRGNVLALLSGVFWALTVSGLRWMERGRGAGEGGGAAAVAVGNLLAFGFALPLALPIASISSKDVIVISYLGIVQIGLAYVFLTKALRDIPALDASLLLLVEPVLNPLWAWIVHGETPTVWSDAGGAIILAATLAKSWRDSRPG